MPNKKPFPKGLLALIVTLSLSPFLGGCAPLVVGGAAVGATVVGQERPVKQAISDTTIQASINKNLLEFSVDIFQRVDISVVEGKVLLTGLVPEPQNRLDAARLAWQADGVREVLNEIEIKDKSTLTDAARDTWITTKLRSKITFDEQISGVNYTIDTVNQRIYLLGIAQSQAELDRVISYARDIDYVRGVIPYVRIKEQKAGTGG
ncbi:MAG: BON domain-containing protein [Alphaproteobacteria bacterium]|nr:BON domain-containing protein [Alphaproteobacteria bacterium]